jgi:hypothetical protein
MDYTGRFTFPVAPLELWSAIERIDQFERWWSWLGDVHLDGDGLQAGTILRGTVAPPVPYRMRVAVQLDRCLPGQLIDAEVSGDLAGGATLRLRPEGPDGHATVAQVAWSLEMKQLPMRVAARIAYPILRWGHDRVVEATVQGFRRQLAGD